MSIVYKQFQNPLKAKPIDFIPDQLQQTFGQGFRLPLTVINNDWQMLGGLQKIQQNMFVTIMTPVGCHLMQPDFGSTLPFMVLERYTPVLQQQMIATIKNALAIWVPQIKVMKILFDDTLIEKNIVLINIVYSLKGTSAENTLKIGFSTPDNTQLPPSIFMVNQTPIFKTQ